LSTTIVRELSDEPRHGLVATREQRAILLFLERVIFGGLLGLLILIAVPYGTVEPWSEALFECLVLLLAMLWLIQGLFAVQWLPRQMRLFYPMFALIGFALFQSVTLWQTEVAGEKVWYSISADAFETRRFVLKVGSLIVAGILLARYTTSRRRLSALVHLIIIVAAASALFGIVRQSVQHGPGFLLPFLKPGSGYAQFTNRNHFAFLMEMAMGLVTGLMIVRSRRRERVPLYGAILLALWTALVLCNSRGGILSMIVQLICGVLLLSITPRQIASSGTKSERGVLKFLHSIAVRVALLVALLIVVIVGVFWIGGDPLATSLENVSLEIHATDQTGLYERTRRRDIWRATWLMFKAHPLAGAGFAGYWAEIPQYHEASGVLTPQQAHNDYLEILASGGAIGAVLLVWFGITLVKQARKALQSRDPFYNAVCLGTIIGIVGVSVHSIFDFGLHITINALIFVALLAILSLEAINTKHLNTVGR